MRTLYSGISRGTEALVFQGPRAAQRVRSACARRSRPASFRRPSSTATATSASSSKGPRSSRGRNVFCLYPHQTRYVVPAGAVHALPDGVPPARAVLAANLETAVNALWDAAPRVGDRVAVVGAGTVGCLVAWLAARIAGAEVELVDVDERKSAAARALGVPFRAPGRRAPRRRRRRPRERQRGRARDGARARRRSRRPSSS